MVSRLRLCFTHGAGSWMLIRRGTVMMLMLPGREFSLLSVLLLVVSTQLTKVCPHKVWHSEQQLQQSYPSTAPKTAHQQSPARLPSPHSPERSSHLNLSPHTHSQTRCHRPRTDAPSQASCPRLSCSPTSRSPKTSPPHLQNRLMSNQPISHST